MPGFLVDGFAYRAKDFERAQVVPLNGLGTKGLKGSDGRWGCVKNIDFVFFNNLPESSGMWIGGYAFKHQGGGAGK